MNYIFNCKNCGVDSDYLSKPKVFIDEERVEENKKSKKDHQVRLRAKKKKDKKFEQQRKSFLGQYNSYKKEYKEFDERSWTDIHLHGIKPYHERFDFDHFMWDKHRGLWEKSLDFKAEIRFPGYVLSPTLKAERYLICPVCKGRRYIDDWKIS